MSPNVSESELPDVETNLMTNPIAWFRTSESLFVATLAVSGMITMNTFAMFASSTQHAHIALVVKTWQSHSN